MTGSCCLPRLFWPALPCGVALCLAVAGVCVAQTPGCGLLQTPGVSTVTMTVNGVRRLLCRDS
jgi:hypothetical protein